MKVVKQVDAHRGMRTEPFLEKQGIEVTDTDLGERIIQFRKSRPAIVMPAIHLKEEIGELFHEKLTPKENFDPTYLTAAACLHLRQKF